MNIERISNIVDLPWGIMSTEIINENKDLPWSRPSVLVGDDCGDDITYLILTKNTKRDWTKNTNVDSFYERIYSSPGDYYVGVMEQWKELYSCYIDSDKMKIIKK